MHRTGACGAPPRPDEQPTAEGRELRCCEPRDLIERALSLCRFRGRPEELSQEVLDVAWAGYFGASGAAPDRHAGGGVRG